MELSARIQVEERAMCCHSHRLDDGCGCRHRYGHQAGFVRRFQTKQERLEELQEYLRQLKAETQAVEEQLAEMNR